MSYLRSFRACFDGEAEAAEVAAAAAAAEAAAAAALASAKPTMIPSDQVQGIVAKEVAKAKNKAAEVERALAKTQYETLVTKMQAENVSKDVYDILKVQADEAQSKFETSQETAKRQAAEAKMAYESRLKEVSDKATRWEQQYANTEIARGLQAAAVQHEAFNPDQLVQLLKPNTKLVEKDGTYSVQVTVQGADGKEVVTDPSAAVGLLKGMTTVWGNLFKTKSVAGSGGSTTTNVPAGSVDIAGMTRDQYLAGRGKTPGLPGYSK